MGDNKKVDASIPGNPTHPRTRPNRTTTHRSRPLHLNREGNWLRQTNSETAPDNLGVNVRNTEESGQNSLSHVAPEPNPSGSSDSNSSSDYYNGSGLNGIRQLHDDLDTFQAGVDATSANSSDSIPSVNISNNVRYRNVSPASHRGERRRVRRRIQNPGNSRNETFVRNTSPSRSVRSYHATSQHAPSSRFSLVPSLQSPLSSPSTDSTSSSFSDGLFPPFRHISPFSNPYPVGLGTEDEPIMLSPDFSLSDDSSSAPIFSSPSSNLQSDEEIARQLQQEEWEAASSFSARGHGHRPSRSSSFNTFHYPHFRRYRASELSPFQGMRAGAGNRASSESSGEGSSHVFGGGAESLASNSLPVFRPLAPRRRHQDDHPPMRARLDHWSSLPEEFESSYGNLALLTDLLSSYGLYDMADLENILHPGVVGQRALLNPDFMDYESLLALGEQLGEVSKGMEQSEIDRLNICRHTSSPQPDQDVALDGASATELPQCSICLTDYEKGEAKRVLPCKHQFHKQCVDQWLKTNATCPVCRSDVRSKDCLGPDNIDLK